MSFEKSGIGIAVLLKGNDLNVSSKVCFNKMVQVLCKYKYYLWEKYEYIYYNNYNIWREDNR